MDNSVAKRQELANRLEGAGCAVNLVGTDWQKVGDLNPPTIQPGSDSGMRPAPNTESPIRFAGSRVARISQANYALWEEGLSGSVPALVLQFTNEARPQAQNYPLLVKASLTYTSDEDEIRIGGGCWVGASTDFCGLAVEETHALVVAMVADRQPTTISKQRKYGGMGGDQIVVDMLPIPKKCDVRVRLVDVESGTLLYEGQFELSFSPPRIVPKKAP
jgi:hypothetical protein